MKIANWYENCKAILTFWCIVPMLTFAISIWDTGGMKNCSATERMFWFDCSVDDKNSTKQSLAKPSTIHILILIPMLTQSDSYFKPCFLCSPRKSTCKSGTWTNYFMPLAIDERLLRPFSTRKSTCKSGTWMNYLCPWEVLQRVPESVSSRILRSDMVSCAQTSGTPKIKMTARK